MLDKKNVILMIFITAYISFMGLILPLLFIRFDLSQSVYSFFEDLKRDGLFFLLYIISTILFFPFIYSTLVKEKLSLSIRRVNKKGKNPRYYSILLFVIGIPIMCWLIAGCIGYNKIYGHTPGLGELVNNGFLVLLLVLLYFCLIPAFLLAAKKGKMRA